MLDNPRFVAPINIIVKAYRLYSVAKLGLVFTTICQPLLNFDQHICGLTNFATDTFQLGEIFVPELYSEIWCAIGCTLCAMGDIEDAKNTFKKALQYDDRHVEVTTNISLNMSD